MKQLILSFFLLSCTCVFCQIKINLDDKWVGDPELHVFPDGTSSILVNDTKNNFYYTFDHKGKMLTSKQLGDGSSPKAFMDKQKSWATWYTSGLKTMDVYIGDFDGSITKTTFKHKYFKSALSSSTFTEDGKLEIYFTHNVPSNYLYEKGFIDYLVIQYDPIAKTFKMIDYTDIPNIEGSTSFIGVKGNERYFVNWIETTKNNYKFQVLAVDEHKKFRTFAPNNYVFDKKNANFAGGSIVGLKGGEWQDYEDIFYTIQTLTYRDPGRGYICEYKVCKVNEKAETSAFTLQVPINSRSNLVHLPMYCFPKNEDEEYTFSIRDVNGNGLILNSDFSSSNVTPKITKLPVSLEVYHYQDLFPELHESSQTDHKSSSFNLCDDGYARLLMQAGDEFILYQEKIPQ